MSSDSKRFGEAVVWNVASQVVLAASGFLLLLLITGFYDEATFGVFNQALATYIFASQLAVGGINNSTLRAIAERREDEQRVATVIVGAVVPTAVLALATSALVWLARGSIADWLDSPPTELGIEAIAPGLFFFALNKVGLSVVNGLERMRAFALYTSLRYLLILVGLLGFLLLDTERANGARLAFVFTFSEAILLLVLAFEVVPHVRRARVGDWLGWSGEHLSYGVRSMASGMLLELNARVDVLMIGHYMADRFVGIYSVAAMVAEGVYQLLVVLQNMYNPILAREIAARRFEQLRAVIRRGRWRTYGAMLGVGAVAVLLYPHILPFLTNKPGVAESDVPFAWLMLGIVLAAGYIPFGQTLLMANHPGWHTVYMVVTVMINVIGNAILIPHLGLAGAAISTANSMFLSIFVLQALVRWRVGLRL